MTYLPRFQCTVRRLGRGVAEQDSQLLQYSIGPVQSFLHRAYTEQARHRAYTFPAILFIFLFLLVNGEGGGGGSVEHYGTVPLSEPDKFGKKGGDWHTILEQSH